VKKIALWGSIASIAGFGLAVYLMAAQNGPAETIKASSVGDNSPAIGSNAGTININNYSMKASEELPIEISQGMPYEQARTALLTKGWQTIAMNTTPNMSPVCWSNWEGEASCKYQEIDSCAGSGIGFCVMYFKDGKGKYLYVRTIGGPPPEARVDTWGKSENPPEIQVHEY